MYIVLAIIMFGVLIAVHEFGHFITAKALGVRVNEFAIGMGPAILKKQKGETQYSLRILPVGGFCAMEGEDGDSEDPRAFSSKPIWKRFLVLFAGSGMNFLAGFLVVLVIAAQTPAFSTTTLNGFMDGFELQGESGLMAGDTITAIDGHNINTLSEFNIYMARTGDTVDLTVRRDGKKVQLADFPLTMKEYQVDGGTVSRYGPYFNVEENSVGVCLKQSFYSAVYFVRLVVMSLGDLVKGTVGVKELSGPVGIVSAIQDVGESSETTQLALMNIAYFAAFIAVNLAVMNLLPIPALDGGRIFFMLVTWLIEAVSRKKVNPKYEAYIHGAGLVLLLGLMAFVMFNDVVRIFNG